MKKKFFNAVTALIFCGVMANQNFVSAEISAETKSKLDAELSNMIGDEGDKVLGFGVIAYKDGEEVYKNFFGRRHISPDKPMTEDTLLRVASVSKMFTVFSIMQLVEQGKIDLKADASDYLGFKLRNPNFPDDVITVEMLADHTSSVVDNGPYFFPQGTKLKDVLSDSTYFSDKKPGEFFDYCNLNFGILGTILENVTGERFDIYQREHILKQLDTNADYLADYLQPEQFKNLGTIYRKREQWTPQVDYNTKQPKQRNFKDYKIGTNATLFAPQGGLRISFNDLGKTLQMLMNEGNFNGEQILNPQSYNEIISNHWNYDETLKNGKTYGGVMLHYGLGTYKLDGNSTARLCKDYEVDLIGHSGEAYGLISGIYFRPGTHDGVLFMINGTAVDADEPESFGKFSGGYIWEENIVNPICKYIFVGDEKS